MNFGMIRNASGIKPSFILCHCTSCQPPLYRHRAVTLSEAWYSSSNSLSIPHPYQPLSKMPATLPNGSRRFSSENHSHLNGAEEPKRTPNRLILCFDGTGNEFKGNTTDTNIVKLYNKFDRSDPHQMHYYQPGIGTYTADGASVNVGWFGKLKRSVSQSIDAGLATTFDSHVIAGYRFLMRYYGVGDQIYIFGFSRGAFTARFLARMVSKVGLLSQGNEEMVPFAYKIYQDYEMGDESEKAESLAANYISKFKQTFCRDEHAPRRPHGENEVGIKVHFLGLFDTVSSVGTFDVPFTKKTRLPEVGGTAEHVRHAVAIDERRVKFKAALFDQDNKSVSHRHEDIEEVWFVGNHGDVGGGWPAVPAAEIEQPKNFFEKLKSIIFPSKDTKPAPGATADDPYQLSDIALNWMIDELNKLGKHGDQIQWDKKSIDDFKNGYSLREADAIKSHIHDTMKFGKGSSWGMVIFWNILEYLPFIKRWELHNKKWEYVTFPLNRGGTRDIPLRAKFHPTVLQRMRLTLRNEPKYAPTNDTTVPTIGSEKGTHHLKDLELVREEGDQYLRAGVPKNERFERYSD